MIPSRHLPDPSSLVLAGYVRRSSEMQKDNYSLDAQKRALTEAAKLRGLPEPLFFEDDERSARGEHIDDEELYGEMAAAELALKQLNAPEVNGVKYEEVIEAGEHLPDMAALWDVATVEERAEGNTLPNYTFSLNQ